MHTGLYLASYSMRLVLFLIMGLFVSPPVKAQLFPHLTFQKFYDNRGEDIPAKLLRTPDGHLIMGGTTYSHDSIEGPSANVWIAKVDSMGELIWDSEVVLTGLEVFRDMELAEDGGIVFVGVTNTLIDHRERGDAEYGGDYFIGKMDSLGEVEWLRGAGGSSLDQANSISRGVYREYLIAGSSHSNDGEVAQNNGMSDIWVLKIDSNGKTRYSGVKGGNRSDWASSVITCQNGDYLLAGMTNSMGLGAEKLGPFGNGLLMRLSQTGDLIWQRTFACPEGGSFSDVVEAPDSTLLIAGSWRDSEQGKQFWWLKLDDKGNRLYEKVIEGPGEEVFTAISPCSDGGSIMGGYAQTEWNQTPYAKGKDDFWLVRTHANGRILWRNTYGGPDGERCADVLEYRPGVYYAIGEKKNDFQEDGRVRGKDFWLIRIEEHSCREIEPDIFVRSKDFKAYRDKPLRFRARYKYGDRFLWDFGDGTTSEEEQPLKTFTLPGSYQVVLQVFANESCQQSARLSKMLDVW